MVAGSPSKPKHSEKPSPWKLSSSPSTSSSSPSSASFPSLSSSSASNFPSLSSSSSSNFPSLASTSSRPQTRRSRSNATRWSSSSSSSASTTTNPYPPRLQEMNQRFMERISEARQTEGSLARRGIFGFPDISRDEAESSSSSSMSMDLGDGEAVTDQWRTGIPQVYGLSRVTVRDLSDPSQQGGKKGKNKVKRQVIAGGSLAGQPGQPAIYERSQQPYVQARRRAKGPTEREDVVQSEKLGRRTALSYSAGVSTIDLDWPLVDNVQDQPALADVIRNCQRQVRLLAVGLRGPDDNASPLDEVTAPKPFDRLFSRLLGDLLSPHSILAAEWTADAADSGRSINALLNVLPDDIAERCRGDVIPQGILAFTSHLHRRLVSAQSPAQDLVSLESRALLRLLRLCLDLAYHSSWMPAYTAILTSIADLDDSHILELTTELLSWHVQRQRYLIKSVVDSVNALLEQYRLLGVPVSPAGEGKSLLAAVRCLEVFWRARQQSLPEQDDVEGTLDRDLSDFYLPELCRSEWRKSTTGIAASLLPVLDSNYAFLHPLPLKISRLAQQTAQTQASARQEILWTGIYNPSPHSSTHVDASETSSTSAYWSLPSVSSHEALLLHTPRSPSPFTSLQMILDSIFAQSPSYARALLQIDLRVKFLDPGEEGVDSILGGVRREWFDLVCRDMLRQRILTSIPGEDAGSAQPPSGFVSLSFSASDSEAQAAGIFLAWAVKCGVPLGIRLPQYVTQRLLTSNEDRRVQRGEVEETRRLLRQLAQLRPRMATSLMQVLEWQYQPHGTASSSETVSDEAVNVVFQETFSLSWSSLPVSSRTFARRSKGPDAVTLSERDAFVHTMAQSHLSDCAGAETSLSLLARGFQLVLPPPSPDASMSANLHPQELSNLLLGSTEGRQYTLSYLRSRAAIVGTSSSSSSTTFNASSARSQRKSQSQDRTLIDDFWSSLSHCRDTYGVTEEDIVRGVLKYVTASAWLPFTCLPSSSTASVSASAINPQEPNQSNDPIFSLHLIDLPPHLSFPSDLDLDLDLDLDVDMDMDGDGSAEEQTVNSSRTTPTRTSTSTSTSMSKDRALRGSTGKGRRRRRGKCKVKARAKALPLPTASTCTRTLFLPRYPLRLRPPPHHPPPLEDDHHEEKETEEEEEEEDGDDVMRERILTWLRVGLGLRLRFPFEDSDSVSVSDSKSAENAPRVEEGEEEEHGAGQEGSVGFGLG